MGSTFIVIVVAVAVAVIVAAIVSGVVVARRRGDPPAVVAEPPPRTPRPEPTPMRGLEDALNQVTDRTGTTMAARLDAEAEHVDRFRQTDDTGPLLRRALDSVDGHDAGQQPPGAGAAPDEATGLHGDIGDAGEPDER